MYKTGIKSSYEHAFYSFKTDHFLLVPAIFELLYKILFSFHYLTFFVITGDTFYMCFLTQIAANFQMFFELCFVYFVTIAI